MNNQESQYIARLENEDFAFEGLDQKMITKLAQHEDSEVRCLVAEVLWQYSNDFCDGILLQMLTDADELVRCNACDSLGASRNVACIPSLLNRLADESELVRCYAVMGASDIILSTQAQKNQYAGTFKKALKKEKGIVRIACLAVLVQFGERRHLRKIFGVLRAADYHHQIFAANALGDLKNEKNKRRIERALKKAYQPDIPVSVKEAFACAMV